MSELDSLQDHDQPQLIYPFISVFLCIRLPRVLFCYLIAVAYVLQTSLHLLPLLLFHINLSSSLCFILGQVLKALGVHTDVPVPRVFCLCTDASIIGTPFYIMEYLEGWIYSDNKLPVRYI